MWLIVPLLLHQLCLALGGAVPGTQHPVPSITQVSLCVQLLLLVRDRPGMQRTVGRE